MTARDVPVPATGRQIELRAGGASAVVTEVGASVRVLRLGGRDVVDGVGPGEPALDGQGQALVPWPNRVRDGRYRFAGRELQLPLTEPAKGNAIHGFGRFAAWDVAEAAPDRARLRLFVAPQAGYPFALEVEVEHVLDAGGLTVRTTGRNVGDAELPFGAGFHPYVTAGTPRIDDTVLQVRAGTRLVTDERGIPTGERAAVAGTEYDFATPRPLGATSLDTAFGDLARDDHGRATVRLRAPDGGGVDVWLDEHHRYLMLFTGDTLPEPERRRRSLGVEPMTCAPDAFRSGDGLRTLAPGESLTCAWGIRAA
ncbi:MAG TPA: aldose 1-epimerase family protein [Solirubrobacteraceae bacterium]|nr:aldose 1-epimerase family protein [Solirubrobacteraceae bacterium]